MASGPSVVLHSGYTVACFGPDGSIGEGRQGLYEFDTRVLARHQLTIGGRVPDLVTAGLPESDQWEAALRIPCGDAGRAEGPILPQDALEVLIRRRIGPGMIEAISVRNRSAESRAVVLALALDGDFADVAEVA